jgi:hypothetical protein
MVSQKTPLSPRAAHGPRTLAEQIERKSDLETFFREAPRLHPNASKITGVICGVRIEEIEDPLMRKIRYMDKLVDELAGGRPMEKMPANRSLAAPHAQGTRHAPPGCAGLVAGSTNVMLHGPVPRTSISVARRAPS